MSKSVVTLVKSLFTFFRLRIIIPQVNRRILSFAFYKFLRWFISSFWLIALILNSDNGKTTFISFLWGKLTTIHSRDILQFSWIVGFAFLEWFHPFRSGIGLTLLIHNSSGRPVLVIVVNFQKFTSGFL